MKTLYLLVAGLVIIAVIVSLTFVSVNPNLVSEPEEDVSNYDIRSRYDCHKIQTPEKYNECVSFYFARTPYKKGHIIVPVKSIND